MSDIDNGVFDDASTAAPDAAPVDPFGWVPEKHRVPGADGAIDLQASYRRTADAYRGLEKRLAHGFPPETPDGYKLEGLPEHIDAAELLSDPGTKAFLQRCHAKGMSDAQVADVLNYGLSEWLPSFLKSDSEQTVEQAAQYLREWKGPDADLQAIAADSYRSVFAIARKAGLTVDDVTASGLGNNATFIRLMAAIANEVGEDVAPQAAGAWADRRTIEEAQKDPAYHDPKHPQHEKVSAEVRAYFERRYPGQQEH